MRAVAALVVGTGRRVPRIEPVVVAAARATSVLIPDGGVTPVRAAIRLPDDDALAARAELFPNLIRADHFDVPLRLAADGSFVPSGRFIGRDGAQARAGEDAIHFGTRRQIQADESPALHFHCVDEIIRRVFHAEAVEARADVRLRFVCVRG